MEGYSLKEKAIMIIVVVIALIIAFLFYQRFQPEVFMNKAGDPIGMADIQSDLTKSYTGKTAGEDIPHITSAEDLEQITGNEYVTAVPKSIVKTGIYGLKPWVDPYEITKGRTSGGRLYSTGRKAPEVTDVLTATAEYYREYYLIELEDSSYILAQFDSSYKNAIENGDTVTLPIGLKKTNSNETRRYLSEICSQYNADDTYTLYMADDEWDEENNFTLIIIRLGAAAVLFFVLAVALMLASWKVFRFR